MPSTRKNKTITGFYKHYKGKFYQVLGIARHSENLEEFVLYKALYKTTFGKNSLWVRPKKMFFGKIIVDGRKVARFAKIKKPV